MYILLERNVQPGAVITVPDAMIGGLTGILANLVDDPKATYTIPEGLESMEVEEVIKQRVQINMSDGRVCDLALTWASDTGVMAVHIETLDEEDDEEEVLDGTVL